MQAAARKPSLFSRFASSRSGNFGLMAAIVAPTLCLAAGYGLNIAQITMTRSNLLAAIDSAVTSTARDLTTGVIAAKDAEGVVTAFLMTNGTRGFAEPGRITLDKVVVDKAASTVSAQASVVIDIAFPLFGLPREQKITTGSAAVYSNKKIEIAMMLDVTDSMAGQKIKDLRAAASSAVDTLMSGQNQDNPRVRIALVPYSNAVNAGPLSQAVYVEKNRNSATDAPGMAKKDIVLVSAASSSKSSLCASEREHSRWQYSDVGPTVAMVNQDYRVKNDCPAAAMMPLTTNVDSLQARIKSLSVSGYTAGQIGIQWSWYMLSPKWGEVLATEAKPAAYDDDEVVKYAILMTDGQFNTAYAGVADNRSVTSQVSKSTDSAGKLCDEMKKAGIEIFTIGFHLNAAAQKIMEDCASPDVGSVQHFFAAASGDQLVESYQTIARNIERLALTK